MSTKSKKYFKRQKLERQLLRSLEKNQKLKKDEEAERLKEREKLVKGRHYTLSIAVPGSILDNAQSIELRTYLAGQIARAAVVFCVQEIIVFDDKGGNITNEDAEFTGMGKSGGDPNIQLARILQYLECPQYMRKLFFPKHSDLQYAGLLNPLDCPHHARETDDVAYREGIVSPKEVKPGKGSLVDVGLKKYVQIDKLLREGMRVTVHMADSIHSERKKLRAKVVSANTPWKDEGMYWGYTVRIAGSLSAVLSECPYTEGYDVTMGTSDKGRCVHDVTLPKFKHGLVVFGGLEGLESALESDERITQTDAADLFDLYLNTCPQQGSRTIRTEEAILITLAALQPKVSLANTVTLNT